MKDFPFSFEQLSGFSKCLPYGLNLNEQEDALFKQLKQSEIRLHFPAIRDDIGQLINFLFRWIQPEQIFEFGSGYGQSCFWYFLGNMSIQKVTLTEKRSDLKTVFEQLPWPSEWKKKIDYYNDDAFSVIDKLQKIDFVLIDGVKSDYLNFLKVIESKISRHGVVLIDNSYWRGSFLDEEQVTSKHSARSIKALHDYIRHSNFWDALFIPYEDGVSLLRPII